MIKRDSGRQGTGTKTGSELGVKLGPPFSHVGEQLCGDLNLSFNTNSRFHHKAAVSPGGGIPRPRLCGT